MADKKIIPVFYACDDNFIKFTIVSITSLIENASRDYHYDIHILYTKISRDMKKRALALGDEDFTIIFDDVTHFLKAVSARLPVRDYYSLTTYYRFFIVGLYPEYEKAVYIDSDTVVLGDISELYNYELGENYAGVVHEQAVLQENIFGEYVEKCLGIDRGHYFNAGVLLMNCVQFREKRILDRFISLLHEYTFTVAQDQDYLNVLCKDKVVWLDDGWNMEVFGEIRVKPEDFKLIHYIMWSKPWHFEDCRFKEYFWKYAEKTSVCRQILETLRSYPESRRAADMAQAADFMKLALAETNRPDNFLNRQTPLHSLVRTARNFMEEREPKMSEDRLRVLKKIDEYEIAGKFDQDVEDDIPGRTLEPGEVDFEQKKLSSRMMARYAFGQAVNYRRKMLRQKKIIMKGVTGLENLSALRGGAVITCNHFNAYDSFVIQYVYEEIHRRFRKGKFFRVIREGNYTAYPGFYGLLMRHCNTLPLSSNHKVMGEFFTAVNNLLKAGNFVLVYPEQGMWWNYRKPRPLKKGAFSFAVNAGVPVLPCFITLHDSGITGSDGFPVQEYTVHIAEPIYPQETFSRSENIRRMADMNYAAWKKIYEDTYKIPLQYKAE